MTLWPFELDIFHHNCQVLLAIRTAVLCALVSIPIHFRRPIQRFCLEFSFQILLDFRLMTAPLPVLRYYWSCTAQVYVFCVLGLMLWRVIPLLADTILFCISGTPLFHLFWVCSQVSKTVDCFNFLYFPLLAINTSSWLDRVFCFHGISDESYCLGVFIWPSM